MSRNMYFLFSQEDDKALESGDLSDNTRLAITLRRNEKELLINALSFCKEAKEQWSDSSWEKETDN